MALDFPNAPTVGQTFPSPPQAGLPTWQWDGSEWKPTPQAPGAGALTPKTTVYTSGSGIHTITSGCMWARVRMLGGGGGGQGGGASPGTGGVGGNTTFGGLSANGGSGPLGGSASLASGWTGIATTGTTGPTYGYNSGSITNYLPGGNGAAGVYGGGGLGGTPVNPGSAAAPNSGSGGGGGSSGNSNTIQGAAGGGAGGFIDAITTAPAATYSYAVGVGGPGGTAGTGGAAGGLGGSGIIIVDEYGYFSGVADPGAVRFDLAQALTFAQREQGRINIAAASIANPAANLFINGDMSIAEEFGVGTNVTPLNNATKYVADQWVFNPVQAANTAGWAASVSAPTVAYPGLVNQLGISSTAWTPGSVNDYVVLEQFIEGQRWAKLGWGSANAMPVSIGFWILPNISGTIALSVRGGGSRSYVAPISVTSSVWQYKTVTIPGDVAGTWATDTGVGATISLCFGCGSSYVTPNTNVWQAGNYIAQTGISNLFSGSYAHYLAGFSAIPGNMPVPLEMSGAIRRDPAEELRLCQRYFESWTAAGGAGYNNIAPGAANAANQITVEYLFKVRKRLSATGLTFSYSALADFSILWSGFGAANAVTALAMIYYGIDTCTMQATGTGSPFTPKEIAALAANNPSTNGRLFWNARF